MLIKIVKMSRFVANLYRNQLALNKMYPLKTYEVDQELGGEECPLLHAGGWEIDHQEKHCKSPGVCMGGGHGYRSIWNHSLMRKFRVARLPTTHKPWYLLYIQRSAIQCPANLEPKTRNYAR